MIVENTISKLNSISTKFAEKHSDAELISELEELRLLIREFFSDNKNAIKSLYDQLSTGKFDEVEISCINLKTALSMYQEYLQGMMKFVGEIIQSNDSAETYLDKMNTAVKNDSVFIGNIFGGNINPEDSVKLTEAIQCLENLVDFSGQLGWWADGSFKVGCDTNTCGEGIGMKACEMAYKSIGNFAVTYINTAINTYAEISGRVFENDIPKPVEKPELFI